MSTKLSLALALGFALGAGMASATEGQEPLARSLAGLKADPQDRQLRETIIRQVLAMRNKPESPAEVDELEGRAAAALKDAKGPADCLDAAQAYEKALALAPWLAADYLGLANALEKAGKDREAAANLRFYLLAAPKAPDARELRRRIGALEYRAEKAAAGRPPVEPGSRVRLPGLEGLAGRPYTETFQCGRFAPAEALRKRADMACSQEELLAGHWHRFSMTAMHEVRLPEDGTIQVFAISTFQKTLELQGKPQGPRWQDVRWTRCDDRGACAKPVWVRIGDDQASITFSPDRPSDDSGLDPQARYAYTQYRRP